MSEVAATAILIASGIATRYDPDVMQAVVANRVEWGHLPADTNPATCVALLDRKWIGQTVWIETPQHRIVGPLTVCDCAAEKDKARLEQVGFAVDLSWELANQLDVIDDIGRGFRVWSDNPRQAGARLSW